MRNIGGEYTVFVRANSDLSSNEQRKYLLITDQCVGKLDTEMYGDGRAIIDFCCVGIDMRSFSPRGIVEYSACSRKFATRLKARIEAQCGGLNVSIGKAA